jgi:hypothetical protein
VCGDYGIRLRRWEALEATMGCIESAMRGTVSIEKVEDTRGGGK